MTSLSARVRSLRQLRVSVILYNIYACDRNRVDTRILFRNLATFVSLYVAGLLGTSNIFLTFLERHTLYPNVSRLDENKVKQFDIIIIKK